MWHLPSAVTWPARRPRMRHLPLCRGHFASPFPSLPSMVHGTVREVDRPNFVRTADTKAYPCLICHGSLALLSTNSLHHRVHPVWSCTTPAIHRHYLRHRITPVSSTYSRGTTQPLTTSTLHSHYHHTTLQHIQQHYLPYHHRSR